MGSTSHVTNYGLFIYETGKGVASVRNVWDIDREPSRTFRRTLGPDSGKVGEHEATLTIGPGVWWLVPFFHVGIIVHLYRTLKA